MEIAVFHKAGHYQLLRLFEVLRPGSVEDHLMNGAFLVFGKKNEAVRVFDRVVLLSAAGIEKTDHMKGTAGLFGSGGKGFISTEFAERGYKDTDGRSDQYQDHNTGFLHRNAFLNSPAKLRLKYHESALIFPYYDVKGEGQIAGFLLLPSLYSYCS